MEGCIAMFTNKLLNTIILVFLFILTVIFSGCGGITTPGISQDTLSAVITANPTSGEAPLEVIFDASESSAAQGNEIVSYEWDFGDGKTGEGGAVQHGFDSPGNCTVILTISDNKGFVDTSSVTIEVFQPTETVMEQSFDLQNGTEFDTGTGLKVSVSPLSTGGEAKLVVVENHSLQQPEGGFIELQSIYDISLVQESISKGQKIVKKSSEEPLNVELMFDIPPGTDPNSVVILEWTDAGWVLASSSDNPDSIDSLGGILTPDGHNISIELHHLSTYALSHIEFNWGAPVIFPQISDPSITTEGDICIDVLLESPHWGIISVGAWYQIEVVNELGCKSIKSTTDLSFGDWGENKGFLGPKENKKLKFTFWGTGGTADIYFSVRDGWPMALRDYLVRVVGKNLDWPYPSREAMENDFIKKCGIGLTETVLTESINILGDELIKIKSIQNRIRSLWKWMRKYGIGNWTIFIGTSKLAVDTVWHVLLNQGGNINYRLIGGILRPLVKVNPAEVVINTGESVQFTASLVTSDGNQVLSTNSSSKWGWDVSEGGSIDGNGLFTANNNTSGTYTIKARTGYFGIDGEVHKVEGEANVIVNVTGSTTLPDAPTSLSPGTISAPGPIISTLTPTLQWQAVPNADYYNLSVSIYPYGTSNIVYYDQQVYGNSITVPSGKLEAGKKYRWNMRAYNSAGYSDYSSDYPPIIISRLSRHQVVKSNELLIVVFPRGQVDGL
jgi:PKD repeat protein